MKKDEITRKRLKKLANDLLKAKDVDKVYMTVYFTDESEISVTESNVKKANIEHIKGWDRWDTEY
ncbi:MAG: hypothetical protein ACTSYG_08510 [Candidatus Heimdallarchaeota archaeon]